VKTATHAILNGHCEYWWSHILIACMCVQMSALQSPVKHGAVSWG
jgi:hypothetical protein